jgi:Fe-S-cluster containining protein
MSGIVLKFRLDAAQQSLDASVRLPDEPLRPVELLPIIFSLTDAVVSIWESQATANGEKISCRAGCGACCRQLVPISELEALHLAQVVAAMPPERRDRVVERFRDARRRAAPALEALHSFTDDATLAEFGKAAYSYFALRIPCPFLEDESCSIHPDRPSICREYLVTSHPEHCARLDPVQVERVPVPVKVSETLIYFRDGRGTPQPKALPLIEALEWAANHRGDPQPLIPAVELFQNFLTEFVGKDAVRNEIKKNL